MRCSRPPAGWECSREEGHDGPCAASPVERKRGTCLSYDECEALFDYVQGNNFNIDALNSALRVFAEALDLGV